MIYTVVCTDINDYVNWQVELLEYSWSRIHQPGKLIRLVACDEHESLPVHRHAEVYRTKFTNQHPTSGDVYNCYNRLYSLQQWLDEYDIQGTILMVDCDVVFRSPIKTTVTPGKPLAQHWLDYGICDQFRSALIKMPDVEMDSLQPITWPLLIDANDLRAMLPRWISATIEIREETKRQESDMFGFLISAHENKLEFQQGTTTAFMPWPDEKVKEAPLIHYCQQVKDINGDRLWGKWRYKPWQQISNPQSAQLEYCRDLLELLNEFARIKNFEESHKNDTIFIAMASYCEPELIDTIESCLEKARYPENLRFGICHQFDNSNDRTSDTCLDRYSEDTRFRYVLYDYKQSEGGCWARNIAQQLYNGETYTLQIDSHTQMVESWDSLLIEMMQTLPSSKPLITQFPPLYSIKKGVKNFWHINDFSKVNTGIAEKWTKDGWLRHPQKIVPENNHFPRYTRVLSGAFVFTTGEWNEVVRQDPEHFYSGEEFALAVRSFTHGYDLFDPNQIVCWHRLHDAPNRKFWDDNQKETNQRKHRHAFNRLACLFDHERQNELGRYALGTKRTLDDYAHFSGIDCVNKTISDDALKGIWTMTSNSADFDEHSDPVIDVTINLLGDSPLLLSCMESTPVLLSLFVALHQKASSPDTVIFLELGDDGQERVMFKAKQLVSIETNPGLSGHFLELLQQQISQHALPTADVSNHVVPQITPFSDDWKVWIWSNFARGLSKNDLFKQLIDHGFEWGSIKHELNHEPQVPLNQITTTNSEIQSGYQANPIATRLDSTKLEIYTIEDFLNEDECESLIDIIAENLKPSAVVGDKKSDLQVISEARTSQTCSFRKENPEHELALLVQDRISKVIGINSSYAESLQAQMYGVGGEYKAHYDWFDPATESFEKHASVKAGGQRTWSVIVYLNDVIAGGETKFENAEITIQPKRGRLVFWNNLQQNGFPNHDALHQACPVEKGDKTILTLWFRSFGEGEMFVREAREMLPRYTIEGLQKSKMPKPLFKQLADFYETTTNSDKRDELLEGEFLENSSKEVPSELIDIPQNLREKIVTDLQPICEKWSQKKLEFTALYGIREYASGTSLKVHTDRIKTHIISAILNIAQDVEEEWPLQITDHMERDHFINLAPGEILLYEGGRLPHGRPAPLVGKSYANIFLHFRPVDM